LICSGEIKSITPNPIRFVLRKVGFNKGNFWSIEKASRDRAGLMYSFSMA